MGKFNNVGRWIQKRPGVWGKKGWERAKTTHGAFALQALKTRLTPERFTKEGRITEAEKRKAAMAVRFGGAKGESAMREFQYRQAMKKQKEMEEKGMLEGGEDALRKMLHNYLDKGDMTETRAIMMKMASDKNMNLRKKDYDDYENKMNVKRNSGSRQEKNMQMFFEDLTAMQKSSGDDMAKYKNDVRRDSDGNLIYVKNKYDEVVEDFTKKREADFNNVGFFKAFDEELPEHLGVLDVLAKKKNMQALNVEGRDNYAKILEKVLARHYDNNDDFKLKDENVEEYTKLLQKMHAKKFISGTGEAILKVEDAERTGDQKTIQKGNESFAKATGYEVDNNGNIDFTTRDLGILNETSRKNKYKKKDKEKEDKVYGREILNDATKKTDNEIVAPLMFNNEIQGDMYKMSREKRGDPNMGQFVDGIANNLYLLRNKLISEVKDKDSKGEKSGIINPEKGTDYTYKDLYNKSDIGKNMNDIEKEVNSFKIGTVQYYSMTKEDQEKYRKYLEDMLDSVVMDAQRASATPGPIDFGFAKEEGTFEPTRKLMDKKIENRKVNRSNLGLVINSVGTLKSTDLTQQNRDKIIKSIENYLKQARKHSESYNKDNVEFNNELINLEKEAKNIKKNTVPIDDFKNRVQNLLNSVEAK